MNVTARSYLTAGVAAIGVGAMALTPIQAASAQPALTQERAVSTLAVNLAASVDPFQPWVDVLKTSVANLQVLNNAFWAKPFPVLQSVIANQFTYLSELPDGALVAEQVFGNVKKFFGEPFVAGGIDYISPVQTGVPIAFNHKYIWGLLPRLLGQETYDKFKPILDLTTTPVSGALLGFAGPGLGATLAFVEGIKEISAADGFPAVVNAILNLPAKVVNAGLNGGQFVNLAPVLGALGINLPSSITSLGILTGGILTDGGVPAAVKGGGVAFDALDVTAKLLTAKDYIAGVPVGLLGTMISTSQYVGKAILVTPPAPPTPPAAATAPTPLAAAAVAEAPEAAPVEAPGPEKADAPDEAPTLIAVPADDDQTPPGVQTLTPQDDPAPSTGGTGHRGGGSRGDNGGGAAKKTHRGE